MVHSLASRGHLELVVYLDLGALLDAVEIEIKQLVARGRRHPSLVRGLVALFLLQESVLDVRHDLLRALDLDDALAPGEGRRPLAAIHAALGRHHQICVVFILHSAVDEDALLVESVLHRDVLTWLFDGLSSVRTPDLVQQVKVPRGAWGGTCFLSKN